jgi:hypothetical protein
MRCLRAELTRKVPSAILYKLTDIFESAPCRFWEKYSAYHIVGCLHAGIGHNIGSDSPHPGVGAPGVNDEIV